LRAASSCGVKVKIAKEGATWAAQKTLTKIVLFRYSP
jgi:hypothetical protein